MALYLMAGELQKQLDKNWSVKIMPKVRRGNCMGWMLFQTTQMWMNAMWPAVDKRIVNFPFQVKWVKAGRRMVEGWVREVLRTPRWETEAMPRRSPGRSMKVIVAAATCALFLVKVL